MAGALVKISETTVSSAVSSVTLTGIDSTYDVYMLKTFGIEASTSGASLHGRVTVGGSPDTTSNYDFSAKNMVSTATFLNESYTNFDYMALSNATYEATTGSASNGIYYLFNFNNSSEYSFVTQEETAFRHDSILHGRAGGFVSTVAQSCNGLNFFMSSGNIEAGTFTLYGLKK